MICCPVQLLRRTTSRRLGTGERYGYALQAAEEEGCIGALEVHMACGLLDYSTTC